MEIRLSVLDITVPVLIVYLMINSIVVSKFPVRYLPFCMLCCCWIAYAVAKQQIGILNFIGMVIFLILLSGIIQCTWGLLQCFNIIPAHAGKYKAVGSFQNPGVYANYLACIFPLALAVLLHSKKEKRVLHVMSLLFAACCIFVMPFTVARAAWLGMLAGTLVVMECRYNRLAKVTRIKKSALVFFVATALTVTGTAGIALYHLKPESTQGRLLIYKIGLDMCKDHPGI
jgi:hypothetical protein